MLTFTLEIKKSKFISYYFELNSIDDINNHINKIKAENKKATHVCYAYVYNKTEVKEQANDDGEPKGSAGYPILNVIKKKNLSNCLVVVVRYFGGIKLGAGGLVRAYTKACAGVLEQL